MKECRECNVVKHRDEFYTHRAKCIECYNKDTLHRYRKNRDGMFRVYYLPEEHYVGMTSDIYNRMKQHSKKGKITQGFEIVWTCKTAAMALLMEAYLHTLGYNGCKY